MHVFLGLTIDIDITIPHEHSMTGMPHAPVISPPPTKVADTRHTNLIYTRDRMPGKRITKIGGNPCRLAGQFGVETLLQRDSSF
jgi:hypothetical protein